LAEPGATADTDAKQGGNAPATTTEQPDEETTASAPAETDSANTESSGQAADGDNN